MRHSREEEAYAVADQKLRMITKALVPRDRFDALFSRVMTLIPPEELQEALLRHRASVALMRFTVRVRSPTSFLRSRFGRLALSASVQPAARSLSRLICSTAIQKDQTGRSSEGGGDASNAAGAPGVEGKPGSESGPLPQDRASQLPK